MSRIKSLSLLGIALIAGAILPFAFAPVHWFIIAILSPAILLWVFQQSTARQAFWQGFCFGLGLFGVGTSWIYISVHHFGNATVFLAALITLLFTLYLALFPALLGYLLQRFFSKKSPLSAALFAFPALWVLTEWLRGWLFTGFPWLTLGDSQVHSGLQGFAPLLGTYGISFILVFMSGCLAQLVTRQNLRIKIISVCAIIGLWIAGLLLSFIHWTTPIGEAQPVSLVQGNISQAIKWSPEHLLHIMEVYKNETEQHRDSRIIVWPESAIPDYPQQIQFYFQLMSQFALKHNMAIITGVPIYNPATQQTFNGMMVLGNGQGVYLKRHLVPFGEYIPLQAFYGRFMRYFSIPLSNLSKGPTQQAPMTVGNHPFAAFICYEIAYPQLVLHHVKNTAFIVVVSDDSWFGESMASAQQLQMAQMRALETGRYILYGTNTGITAIITPQGKIQHMLPENQQAVLTGKILFMQNETPLMRCQFIATGVLLILSLLIALLLP